MQKLLRSKLHKNNHSSFDNTKHIFFKQFQRCQIIHFIVFSLQDTPPLLVEKDDFKYDDFLNSAREIDTRV